MEISPEDLFGTVPDTKPKEAAPPRSEVEVLELAPLSIYTTGGQDAIELSPEELHQEMRTNHIIYSYALCRVSCRMSERKVTPYRGALGPLAE